tara:strand:- start:1334 stop:1687 length:354 start_codon:yes stop_codon:yes gene_type:complete
MRLTKTILRELIKEGMEKAKLDEYAAGDMAGTKHASAQRKVLNQIQKLISQSQMNKSFGFSAQVTQKVVDAVLKLVQQIPQAEKDIDIPHRGATVTDPRTGQVMYAKGLKESKDLKK